MFKHLKRRGKPTPKLEHSRLDALVDGVYSVALTLLILNLNIPDGLSAEQLAAFWPDFAPKALSFVLSFVMAASAWIYVHQMSALYTHTNLGHTVRTVASLMLVCALPLTTAAVGTYPNLPIGPALYAGNIMVLVAIYTLDLALSRKALIPVEVDPKLVNQILLAHVGAVIWAAFCCFYLSYRNPHWGIAGIVAYVVMHWINIWWFEPQMHIARAAIEEKRATAK